VVDPHVEPVGFRKAGDGTISVEVIQTIRDLDGNVLRDQAHGLKDKTVCHIFRFTDGLVSRFDVEDVPVDGPAARANAENSSTERHGDPGAE
jgi:hypothetical protein